MIQREIYRLLLNQEYLAMILNLTVFMFLFFNSYKYLSLIFLCSVGFHIAQIVKYINMTSVFLKKSIK
jgi:hypothetical protein